MAGVHECILASFYANICVVFRVYIRYNAVGTGGIRMNDMTKGDPKKILLLFMVPVLLGNLFQNFYNIADIMIVGRFLGVDALAAVGMTGSITFLVIGWIQGLTSGFGILLAQAFGAKEESRLRHYNIVAGYLCIFFAVVMSVGLLLGNSAILRLMNTPEDIFPHTKAYIGIIYAGLPATILYNMLAATARAVGDSKTPLYFLMLSSIINIGLDILFVGFLPFGVAGAGYATVISQALSGVLCYIYIHKKYPELHFRRKDGSIKLYTCYKLLGMGIPMGLQFSITALGTMIVQTALNQLGSIYIAAFAGSMKIQNLFIQFNTAMGAAIANFAGQNYGAGKIERVKKGMRAAVIMTVIYGVFVMIMAYFFCPSWIVIFAEDPTGELVDISRQIFRICTWFYIPLGLIFVYRNVLQGIGNGLVPMLGGVFELFARGMVIVVLFPPLQFTGVCLADPMAWIFALIPLIPYYYWYMHRLSKKQGAGKNI